MTVGLRHVADRLPVPMPRRCRRRGTASDRAAVPRRQLAGADPSRYRGTSQIRRGTYRTHLRLYVPCVPYGTAYLRYIASTMQQVVRPWRSGRCLTERPAECQCHVSAIRVPMAQRRCGALRGATTSSGWHLARWLAHRRLAGARLAKRTLRAVSRIFSGRATSGAVRPDRRIVAIAADAGSTSRLA